jgi:hypothetical protein
MGRMKDIFIEVMQEYGTVPDDFNLTDYKLKKEIDNAEWQEQHEKLKSSQTIKGENTGHDNSEEN